MPFPLLMGFLWIFLLLMVGLVRNALEKEILKSKVVKAADFGFSRARTQSGVMTAETGTYHWMAPEVIVHQPYDHKAAVLSFGIVACELLARESQLPHSYMNRLRAAVGVVQKGLWPTISKKAHPKLAELLEGCFKSQIKVGDEREDRCKDKPCGSYF